jgi:hypothetical protein
MDAIDDIERKQREERIQVRKVAELFESLMAHPGWPKYIALVETIGQNYHGTIMKPLENVFEATKIEFAKGVLSGLSLATAIPRLKINEAQELRRSAPEEE